MSKLEMPTIKELILESWVSLKSSFGNLFLLGLIGAIFGTIFVIFFIFAIAGVGFLSMLNGRDMGAVDIQAITSSYLTAQNLSYIGFSLVGFFLIAWIITTVVKLSSIAAIGKHQEKPGLGKCINIGFKALIPVTIVTGLLSLLSFGGTFLLIIPGILIAFFFRFTTHELVLGGASWFKAARNSIQIISQHFGAVLLRIILFWIAVYTVFYLPLYFLQMIVTGYAESTPGEAVALTFIIGIIQFFVGILVGFYNLAYGVTIYLHAKKSTDESAPIPMVWIWVTSIIGWIIAIIVGMQLFKLSKTQLAQDTMNVFKSELNSNNQKELSQDEKIEEWINKISSEAKPHWDKSNDLFKQMHEQSNNPKAVKKLNDENIASLLQASKLNGDNPVIWKNLSDAYWWVNSTGTLEDALEASRKAEELDPTIWGYKYGTGILLIQLARYDEAILKLQEVVRAEDNYGKGHISLGVAYNRSRLKSQAAEHLKRGIEILSAYNEDGQFDQEILAAQKELETTK